MAVTLYSAESTTVDAALFLNYLEQVRTDTIGKYGFKPSEADKAALDKATPKITVVDRTKS
ncbi:unnamed protein product [Parascedosporium putredinis]|uniref:Uncharacterized protein n=1 Tax=Parascedosporium putredinis TaxID=1442378 RepID=A0A9P1GWR0_9PEZI|nr:unnamed protein product [Parascedosporium putredinis]CAI7988403.1 unnamed protein product [Parascedosporium putredinis]